MVRGLPGCALAREERYERGDDQPVDGFAAFAACAGVEGFDVTEVVSHGFSFQANETEASPSASMTATPRLASR